MSIFKEKGRFYTKEKDITMNIIFENFTEKHIDEAVTLALAELQVEKNYCTNLPNEDFRKHLTNILQWLSSQQFGKAAISEGKLVGYLIFAGPWDGFFGDVKGVFSPLGGSAFSYDYENRGKLASMLFATICGVEVTLALSIIIASHSTCPKHSLFPIIFEVNSCFELFLAIDLEVT